MSKLLSQPQKNRGFSFGVNNILFCSVIQIVYWFYSSLLGIAYYSHIWGSSLIQSLPNSHTHRAVIGPLGDPTPRMEHVNELCTQYQVQAPKILTNIVLEIPSWTYPPIRICPFLETKKQGLLDEEMRAIFLAHQERHPTIHICTDGSKSTEGVGFAAVFPNTASGGRLTREASIFTAELYAINAAVYEISPQFFLTREVLSWH